MRGVLVGLFLAILSCVGAQASGGRFALVVANEAYPDAPLVNPGIDASIVAPALRAIGFEVTEVHDADIETFDAALVNFQQRASGAEVALFYFAGHGFAISDGLAAQNYLMATSANITSPSERVLRSGGIPLDDVIRTISSAADVALFFIDACRNDPRVRSVAGSGRGLAAMGDPGTDNIFVALSTRLGSTAEDGDPGQGTPFARAFAEVMQEPGLRIDDAFTRIRVAVETATDKGQRPDVLRYDLDLPLVLVEGASTKVASAPKTIEPAVPAERAPSLRRDLTLGAYIDTAGASFGRTPLLSDIFVPAVFEGLVGAGPDGSVVPLLAKSWAVSPDGKTVRFVLRDGVTFASGGMVDAEAVRASLGEVSRAKGMGLENIEEIAIVDRMTVDLRLRDADPDFLRKLTTFPASILATQGNGNALGMRPSTGPFAVTAMDSSQITLARSPSYWGEQPQLDTITIKLVTNMAELAELIARKQVDGVLRSDEAGLAPVAGFSVTDLPTGTQVLKADQLDLSGSLPFAKWT